MKKNSLFDFLFSFLFFSFFSSLPSLSFSQDKEGFNYLETKSQKKMEEETTNKREPWPTGLFHCCSGFLSFALSFALVFFVFSKIIF